MNEVVKYHNDLNNISLGGLTENQINILFTIFAKIKDKDIKELDFNLDEIIKLSGISTTNKEYLETSIFTCFDKIQNLKIRYVDKEESKVQEVIFPKAKINKDRTQLSIKVSETFTYIFNNLIGNFTRFELAEFVSLDSKYSKTLYRLLKQYRTTGYFKIDWEKFKEIMNIPISYKRVQDIEKDIIKIAIKKLSSEQTLFDQKRTPFEKLSYKKLKTKGHGNKVTHIEFYFIPQETSQKIIEQAKKDLHYIATDLKAKNIRKQFEREKKKDKEMLEINIDIFGKEVTELDVYVGRYLRIYNSKINLTDTLKIKSIRELNNGEIEVNLFNADDYYDSVMNFKDLKHFKNTFKKYGA